MPIAFRGLTIQNLAQSLMKGGNDPKDIAAEAMSLFDHNKNGKVGWKEFST